MTYSEWSASITVLEFCHKLGTTNIELTITKIDTKNFHPNLSDFHSRIRTIKGIAKSDNRNT